MAYYARYIVTDEQGITLDELERSLPDIDRRYSVVRRPGPAAGVVDLRHEEDPLAEMEVNAPGDGYFEEDIEELKDLLGEARGRAAGAVSQSLKEARAMVVFRLFGDPGDEESRGALGPLWSWLFAHRRGLLQVDGSGYYDVTGRILEVK